MDSLTRLNSWESLAIVQLDHIYYSLEQPESSHIIASLRQKTEKLDELLCVIRDKRVTILLG